MTWSYLEFLHFVLTRVEGGELFDRVVSVGRFEEQTAKLLFYQMLDAVKVLNVIIIKISHE